MPIYDPLRDRSTGSPQSWDDRFHHILQLPESSNHTGLIPCVHLKMHCAKCGYYNLRVEHAPTYLATSCSHCRRPARVVEWCQGYASPDSPVFTKGQHVVSVEGYDVETRWVKQDGSRAKIRKNWGVARA